MQRSQAHGHGRHGVHTAAHGILGGVTNQALRHGTPSPDLAVARDDNLRIRGLTQQIRNHRQHFIMRPSPHSRPRTPQELGEWDAARFEERGVTVTEWVALRTLLGRHETSHAELIQALGMTKGAASKVISRLEGKGLAKRLLAEGRAREQVLVLTPSGKALVPELAELADANDTQFFGHLPVAEQKALMRAMQELVAYHQLKAVPTT